MKKPFRATSLTEYGQNYSSSTFSPKKASKISQLGQILRTRRHSNHIFDVSSKKKSAIETFFSLIARNRD